MAEFKMRGFRKRKDYSKQQLNWALGLVRQGMSMYKAAKVTGIPKATIIYNIKHGKNKQPTAEWRFYWMSAQDFVIYRLRLEQSEQTELYVLNSQGMGQFSKPYLAHTDLPVLEERGR